MTSHVRSLDFFLACDWFWARSCHITYLSRPHTKQRLSHCSPCCFPCYVTVLPRWRANLQIVPFQTLTKVGQNVGMLCCISSIILTDIFQARNRSNDQDLSKSRSNCPHHLPITHTPSHSCLWVCHEGPDTGQAMWPRASLNSTTHVKLTSTYNCLSAQLVLY